MRLLHAVAFSKKLRWLTQTKVITLKTQLHAVNACIKRSSQRSFRTQDHTFIGSTLKLDFPEDKILFTLACFDLKKIACFVEKKDKL